MKQAQKRSLARRCRSVAATRGRQRTHRCSWPTRLFPRSPARTLSRGSGWWWSWWWVPKSGMKGCATWYSSAPSPKAIVISGQPLPMALRQGRAGEGCAGDARRGAQAGACRGCQAGKPATRQPGAEGLHPGFPAGQQVQQASRCSRRSATRQPAMMQQRGRAAAKPNSRGCRQLICALLSLPTTHAHTHAHLWTAGRGQAVVGDGKRRGVRRLWCMPAGRHSSRWDKPMCTAGHNECVAQAASRQRPTTATQLHPEAPRHSLHISATDSRNMTPMALPRSSANNASSGCLIICSKPGGRVARPQPARCSPAVAAPPPAPAQSLVPCGLRPIVSSCCTAV